MIKPTIPANEEERLKALQSFHILDTLAEDEYDAITRIAADICDTPMALVSLVDEQRQWFKSHFGIDATETPRDLAFCAHAINDPNNLLVVPDAKADERFSDNPLVISGPKVQFYAGAPLNTKDGFSIGTLCVIDTKPREQFTTKQYEALRFLANQVMAQLELRRQNYLQLVTNKELQAKNDQLKHFTYRMAHDMKTPLHGITSLVGFMKEDYLHLLKNTEIPEWLDTIEERIYYMESMIRGITQYIKITNAEVCFEKFAPQKKIELIAKEVDAANKIKIVFDNFNTEINHSLPGFEQIFRNLLQNSLKFCEDPINVWIGCKEDQDFYQFTFEDNGEGIPEKYWHKVFVMFETLHKSGPKDTGIGLATSKSIVERLGGVITLGNRPNGQKGVYFHFTLLKENLFT